MNIWIKETEAQMIRLRPALYNAFSSSFTFLMTNTTYCHQLELLSLMGQHQLAIGFTPWVCLSATF